MSSKQSSEKSKVFQDPVQGLIDVEQILLRFIDTPEFQRLRRLHQLGLANHVYPACTHTRFEHCLGTYYLARRLTDAINSEDNYEKLSANESLSIRIAALCHDLGHGPFSHTWEKFILQGGPHYKVFEHEEMSCLILRSIVAKDEILQKMLKEKGVDLNLVCDLIRGHPSPEVAKQIGNRKFIFEIVSNAQNGNDVDKWDYIMRDSLHAGFGQGSSIIELDRLIRFYRPALDPADGAWHMAFRASERENVLRIFSQRLCLYRKLYSHKTTRALEAMYLDIFNALDPILHLRDICLSAASGDSEALHEFLRLDEHSLWSMASSGFPRLLKESSPEIEENLRRCRILCQRIQLRQFYSLVGRFDLNVKKPLPKCRSCSKNQQDISRDGRFFLDSTFAEAGNRLLSALEVETLGDKDKILGEIFAKLPPNSPVKSVNELRLTVTVQATNSTNEPPIFFAYDSLPDAYSFSYSYVKLYNCLVLWTGPIQWDTEVDLSIRGPPKVPDCLVKAFEDWINEKRAAPACH
ncbi:unnamed protein product [Hymenolepis diminuta]|uniref:HD domain-containing protein n=2 Tax=Hymenolepis diminuta TaxID=6216 RepID=A0A564Y4P3_HYMDI|nr:unnamed protein product [Hymenolepis diminuta]